LLLQQLQKTSIGHVGHDDVRSRTSLKTDSKKVHHMSMFEPTHLQTLLHQLIHFHLIKVPWRETTSLQQTHPTFECLHS
ncbi:hypothetical protein GBAR_LOCUS11378, partial [Geodia barretti]